MPRCPLITLLIVVLTAPLLWQSLAATTNDPPQLLLLDGVAAEVGETRITIAETMLLARELGNMRQLTGNEQARQLRALYEEALDIMIERRLILQTYNDLKQKLPEWVIERRVESMIEEHFSGDRSQLVEMLTKQGIGYDTWRKRMEEEMIITSMRQQFVEQNISVSPGEVRSWYATNQPLFKLDGNVRVGMILIAPLDDEESAALKSRASQILQRLHQGQDFKAVAKEVSAEAHAAIGGDWGFLNPDDELRHEIVAALAPLKAGEISDLIETESGIYIVTKFDEQPSGLLPLSDAWSGIEAELKRRETTRRHAAWVDSLKKVTTVRRFPLPK